MLPPAERRILHAPDSQVNGMAGKGFARDCNLRIRSKITVMPQVFGPT
jgi:hypothetical protein